jgi:hypothetical protein
MRQHCRSQHGYDPEANIQPFRSKSNLQKTVTLPETLENKLKNKIQEEPRLLELALGRPLTDKTSNVTQSAELALTYLLDNFTLVRKRQIQGISGHICDTCLTFHFKYIMDIGGDVPLDERHRCRPKALKEAKNIRDRDSAKKQLHEESVRWLIRLCRSVFGSPMELVSQPISVETMRSSKFHYPRWPLLTIDSNHCVWSAISNGRVPIGQEILEEILSYLTGTFAVMSVAMGEFQGQYLLKVTRKRAVFKSVLGKNAN